MFSFLINIIVMRCTSDIRGNPSQHYDVNIWIDWLIAKTVLPMRCFLGKRYKKYKAEVCKKYEMR